MLPCMYMRFGHLGEIDGESTGHRPKEGDVGDWHQRLELVLTLNPTRPVLASSFQGHTYTYRRR